MPALTNNPPAGSKQARKQEAKGGISLCLRHKEKFSIMSCMRDLTKAALKIFLCLVSLMSFFFTALYTRSYCCAAGVLLASPTWYGLGVAFLGAFAPLLILFCLLWKIDFPLVTYSKPEGSIFPLFRKIPPEIFEKIYTPKVIKELRRVGNIALALFVISELLIVYGGSFYYYATADQIVFHEGFLHPPRTYSWADVREIHEGCSHSSHWIKSVSDFWFDVTLRDGKSFSVNADDTVPMAHFIKDHQAPTQTLHNTSLTYDTYDPDCPKQWTFPATH